VTRPTPSATVSAAAEAATTMIVSAAWSRRRRMPVNASLSMISVISRLQLEQLREDSGGLIAVGEPRLIDDETVTE